ncbi:hypothetical protein LSPCS325_45510 [Lysinibacillus sp. CTST325]
MINTNFIERLQNIDWFKNGGKDFSISGFPINIQFVSSVDDLKNSIASPSWEQLTLEARNRLTTFLHKYNMNEYRRWNEITGYYKGNLNTVTETIKNYADLNGLGKMFVDDVLWIVFGAAMENHYLSINRKIPVFFKYLIDVYSVGNIPCGWIGEIKEDYTGAPIDLSKGTLKVY